MEKNHENLQHYARLRYVSMTNSMLDLIILPTEKCNFRCTYCYADFILGRMDESVVSGINNLINYRSPNLKLLTVNFFGGEPLLAHDVIISICQNAMDCTRKNDDLTFKAMATTNGYLLDNKRLNEYYEVGLRRYQISLDGDADVHDRFRIQANGQGSFDRIWGNILNIRDSKLDVEVLLRLHVIPKTVQSIAQLIDRINNEIGNDKRFNIFLKEIVHLGEPNDKTIDVFNTNSPEFINSIDYLRAKIRFPFLLNDSEQNSILNGVCYASQANSLMIRSDGRLGKCTVALNDDRNDIGRIFPDGTLKVHTNKLAPWLRGLKTLDFSDLHCPLAGLNKYMQKADSI